MLAFQKHISRKGRRGRGEKKKKKKKLSRGITGLKDYMD